MNALQKYSQHTTTSKYPVIKRQALAFDTVVPESDTKNVIAIVENLSCFPLPEKYRELDDVVKRSEQIPSRQLAINRARQKLAVKARDDGKITLVALRLEAGLSQAKLAELLGNSQSGYSLIESGKRDIFYATFERLREILNVSRDTLAEAIKNTQEIRV
jgi:ribosome-binding protein aMBF1 (putative translation factor)